MVSRLRTSIQHVLYPRQSSIPSYPPTKAKTRAAICLGVLSLFISCAGPVPESKPTEKTRIYAMGIEEDLRTSFGCPNTPDYDLCYNDCETSPHSSLCWDVAEGVEGYRVYENGTLVAELPCYDYVWTADDETEFWFWVCRASISPLKITQNTYIPLVYSTWDVVAYNGELASLPTSITLYWSDKFEVEVTD